MANNNLGCTILAISAVILAISTFSLFNKDRENFTEVSVTPTYTPGNSLANTQALEGYQDSIRMNIGTSPAQVNKMGAQYYLDLQNYLNPSQQNLELASNISAASIQAGVGLPGASSSYQYQNGNGYVNNLGYLQGEGAFAPVAYSNERAAQLSKCAKDLPMFAASSLLPKPSSNADNNALSQDAARALAAWTNLSPVEQVGALTSIGHMPYGTTVSERPIPLIPQNSVLTPMFNSSPSVGIPTTIGSFNSTWKATAGPNNYVFQNGN
jgi:hypothetical protein